MMEAVTCPRCRTLIQAAQGTLRCPACGVRTRTAILVKELTRPTSTQIAAGLPASAPSPSARPLSVLDRLIARLRRWRRIHEYPGGGADEANCRRTGRLLMMLSLIPFIVGAVSVLLTPAIAFATLAGLDPETVGLRNVLILTLLLAVPLSLCMGYVWVRLRGRSRDDE